MPRFAALALLLLAVPPVLAQTEGDRLTVDQIMQDPETWIGVWPEAPRWGLQGKSVYFPWNPQGRFESDSLFRADAEEREPQLVPADVRRGGLPLFAGWHAEPFAWDAAQERRVYAEGDDLYLADRSAGTTRRLTQTRAREADPRFVPGRDVVTFERDGQLFALTLETGAVRQLTDLRSGLDPDAQQPSEQARFLEDQQQDLFETLREEQEEEEAAEAAQEREADALREPPAFYTGDHDVADLQIDPTGRYVTFALVERPDAEATQVLDYVTESGYAEPIPARPKVGAPPTSYTLHVQDLRRDTTFALDLHALPGAYDVPAYLGAAPPATAADSAEAKRTLFAHGPYWHPTGRYAALDVRAHDNKDRWVVLLDPLTGGLRVLDHQHDEAWLGGPGISWWGGASLVRWLPGTRDLLVQSEASGYSHFVRLNADSGERRQLTKGDFEVQAPQLSQDGSVLYFLSSEGSPYERHVYRMKTLGGQRERLTTLPGRVEAFQVSPDGDQLALLHSTQTRPPEVFVQDVPRTPSHSPRPHRVTHSTTDAWQAAHAWSGGEIVEIEASDGAQVPAQIFRPDEPNGAAVLFVHGAGYLQNVHRGWSSYFREWMFHQLLQERGYTVVNLDFRASAGYGRDWRTAVHRHMGGRDLQDYVDASQWLEAEYGIQPERQFIYGGSYGGFLTLMALFTEPEHFGGGAALRAVTDWAHYNHGYTANILHTPAEDTLAYHRSSPIYFAEGLDDPLLIAHGVVDDNVQVQDVLRLSQRLIELRKDDWELALYPVEGHGFTEPTSWADEYRRILALIEESVGPEAEMP